MTSALECVDGMDIVGVDNTGATDTAEQLGEDVARDLAPWEASQSCERNGDSGVNVSARNAARDPGTQCKPYEW